MAQGGHRAATFDPMGPLDPSRALVPTAVRVNEQVVRDRFWPKFRRVAARLPFAADLVAVYYAARDPLTPWAAKGLMLAALAYFVLPFDAIPDYLPLVGYTDDAAVIGAVITLVGRTLQPRHRTLARETLQRWIAR